MLRQKRLLYLTATRLVAYSLARGKLALDASFERNDAGVAAFSTYLAGSRNRYYLVVDVVEEDYHQDTIPYLSGKDRRQVLARKLAQRYRDTTLTLSLSLGYEQGDRRNEKVLYASFSNTQQFQPWLTALEQNECRLVGVYSTALLAPALMKASGVKAQRCLLVSAHETGLRQSYVEDGKIRFSRIGRLNLEDASAVAAACASESARLQQYLVTMRLLPTATTPIDVMVLAGARYYAALLDACHDSEVLHYHVVDADAQCRKARLASFPPEVPCEALFLHAAATATPREQFAQDRHRHQYQLWCVGNVLYASGSAVLAAGILFSGAQLFEAHSLRQQAKTDQARFDEVSAEYARVTATFPPTPTSTENLKTTIRQYRILEAQTATPAYLLSEISRVLGNFPQIEIEHINWRVGKPALEAAAKAQPAKATTAATPAPSAGGEGAPAIDAGYEYASVSARVVGAKRSDLRSITDMTNQFVAALKATPRLEILGVDMPFDLAAEDTLKGDIGSERAIAEDARFAVTIGRKLGR